MSNLKILVVDDAAFIRDMVRKTIRTRFPEFSVDEAVDGVKAQQALNKSDYDLILCDWEMPNMSGIELLTWFRTEKGSTTPFVMVTSRGDKENVVEAVQAGVTDYIGKPFSRDKLLGKVVKVLSKNHQLQGVGTTTGAQGIAAGSIDALTSKSSAPPPQKPAAAPAATGSASALTGKPAPAPAAAAKAVTTKNNCHLRFGDATIECGIKTISLKQITLLAAADQGIPNILETVVIDLQQGANGGEVARINAFVHSLSAVTPTINSTLVNVGITIIDNDPQKLAYLSKLIARGTTSTSFVPGA